MSFDGALNIDGAGAGVLFVTPSRDELCYVLRIHFPAFNNAAEYEAALHGLRIATELGVKRLMVYGDSALVINQVNKDWSCTSEKMDNYCAEIRKLEGKFYGIEFHHVVRDASQAADRLSKLGSTRAKVLAGVFIQDLMTPSIKPGEEVIEVPPVEQLVTAIPTPSVDRRDQFIKYLSEAEVPTSKAKMERLIHRSKHDVLVDGKLKRKSTKEELLLKCIS
jgi:ribonuclease HI